MTTAVRSRARAWLAVPAVLVLLVVTVMLFAYGSESAPAETTAPAAEPAAASERMDIDAMASSVAEDVEKIRAQLREAVVAAPDLPDQIATELESKVGPDGPYRLVDALGRGFVALAVGWILASLAEHWARRRLLPARQPESERAERRRRIARALIGGVIGIVAAVVMGVLATAVAEVLHGNDPFMRGTIATMVLWTSAARGLQSIVRAFLAPSATEMRLPHFDDAEARRLFWQVGFVNFLSAAVIGWSSWLMHLGISEPAQDLLGILTSGVIGTLWCWICLANRRAIADAIIPDRSRVARWKLRLVDSWAGIAVAYFVFAWFVRAVRLLLDRPGAEGLITAPLPLLLLSGAAYGLALIAIDRFFAKSVELRVADGTGDRRVEDYRDLAERGAGIVIAVGAAAVLLHLWGVDFIGSQDLGGRIFDMVVVIFLGWLAYDAARIWIDRRIADEEASGPAAPTAEAESSDVPMGTGKSRLATVLPLIRFAVLATLVVIIAMMALSQLGVDITPLFAGAGVVGLAIGFGSRQLVEDVISGAFYLVDDAFRVGEYIDIGKVKGTVEKISIRSFQLRHQNGPLNTIRFGEVASVTNFSRDWAIMKLPLRVPLDADSEKIRKIIKKVGQDLLDDPTYGPMFMEPLKSQGVYSMDDSAQIIRVKFMTKPNDQFVLRRVVYHRINEAFAKAGIHFANRVVTVRVEGDLSGASEETKHKIATAAAAQIATEIADEEAKKASA
jgi:small-conductance mechanosensitive channel